jgi:ectoine hydroxylase-related dioxygenase (phytanoyl-CoA dioxygenase family)
MGANCKRFRLKVATHIDIGPGETAQPLHREDGLYPAAHHGSEWCCDCMWALSDFTPENGATHIVRASHKGPQDTSGRVGYEHTAQAAMPKGSCLIFTGAQKRLSVPIMLYSHPNICQDRLGTDTHRTF